MTITETQTLEDTLETLMERANVNYLQRHEFRSNPAKAIELLEAALRRTSVRKPAAYALARFRAGYFAPRPSEVSLEPVPAPTLEELELAWAWSLPPAALDAIAERVAEHGGFARLLAEAA